MKTIFNRLSGLVVLAAVSREIFSQDLAGEWSGVLDAGGVKLNLVFRFDREPSGIWQAEFDSPDQGAFGLPFSETRVRDDSVFCRAPRPGITFAGELSGGEIHAVFVQGRMSFPLRLSRATSGELRPQNPVPPYPYKVDDVRFSSKSPEVMPAGTLTYPYIEEPERDTATSFPAVVLVSGSGPQNRDCAPAGHKPFAVMADRLTRNGIVVLRYDDRGTASSGGNFAGAVTRDFAEDAHGAWEYLRNHPAADPERTGIIGLSEGGTIAAMLSARNSEIAFVAMLAGPAVKGSALSAEQNEALGRAAGADEVQLAQARRLNEAIYAFAQSRGSAEEVREGADEFAEQVTADPKLNPPFSDRRQIKSLVSQAADPRIYDFLRHDPAEDLRRGQAPVLAFYGGKDLQVPAAQNAPAAEAALAKSGRPCTVSVRPECNHLFQTAVIGTVDEYRRIEETVRPEVMDALAEFILSLP